MSSTDTQATATLSLPTIIIDPPALVDEVARDPLVRRQYELETLMLKEGCRTYRERLDKARQRGHESETDVGRQVTRQLIEPLAGAIRQFANRASKGRGETSATAFIKLEHIDPDAAAYVTATYAIDSATSKREDDRRVPTLAVKIGHAIETECRLQQFAEWCKQNKRHATGRTLYQIIEDDLKAKGYPRELMRTVLIHSMGKAGVSWESWSDIVAFHVGIKLLLLLHESTALFTFESETRYIRKKGKRVSYQDKLYLPSVELIENIHHLHGQCALFRPLMLPMVIPPMDWMPDQRGGYLTEFYGRRSLVKASGKRQRERLKTTAMPIVYAAVNAMQQTPWRINRQVLDVFTAAWDERSRIGGLPSQFKNTLPRKPDDIETNDEARRQWRHDANKVIRDDYKRAQRCLAIERLRTALTYLKEESRLYFPFHLDFRGRAYATPNPLSPQGSDHAKALLQFADGKPITTDEHARWLAIHGANCYGHDKVGMDERVQWVEDNEPAILASAQNPSNCRWWERGDNKKRWQFLAFCFEWAQFKREGFGFVSHLPVAMDGTCNGLQHFSAMARDEQGGAAVNLMPHATPRDIYQDVADKVVAELEGRQGEPLAAFWISQGIDRKMTKKPVMTTPYGSTFTGHCTAIHKRLEKIAEEKRRPLPFGDDDDRRNEAVGYLAKVIAAKIDDTVIGARHIMRWLQSMSSVCYRADRAAEWTTPAGFPVVNEYREYTSPQIETKLLGKTYKPRLRQPTDKLDPHDMRRGIVPNFVHSMDASAMMMTIGRCLEHGITSFGMVHDSYAVHAADAHDMALHLRWCFVWQYLRWRPLDELYDFVLAIAPDDPDALPFDVEGRLKVEDVLKSEFFFA